MASSSPFLFLILLSISLTIPRTQSTPTFFPRLTTYQSSLQKQDKPSKKLEIPFKTHYFPQLLDHFTFQPQSSKIFYQKYLVNNRYWRQGGPIFVYTGNEGNIEWFAANTGFMLDIAPKFNALLVFIEHRFYGESMPFGKDSYKSAETLGYLNSQQALADFAVLIRSLKKNHSSEASPVVVFGGSYGGSKLRNSPFVHTQFLDASLNCYEVIKGSWQELEALSAQKEGLAELSKNFRTCKFTRIISPSFRNLQSMYSVRNWLWEAFVYTAMVNYPTEANFMMPLPAYPVQEMCKIIDGISPGATKLSKAFAAASLYYNYSRSEKCFDVENGTDAHGLHGWGWQACTEMVMPMTCSNESMFPPSSYDYKEFAEDCRTKYGVTPRPHWITTEYGGYRIEQVLKRSGGNIIFSNGMQDPWSRGGGSPCGFPVNNERRSGVAGSAEETRSGDNSEMDR
ncbi:hypothetical protein RHGRI_009164 [Rhododendron griersonianum]|uniref:Lysosomal Pro-X carboxypeptidase n=1 Tax=Rhododendron griersonianum TaxID=479676 RepID=A0AAV6L5Q1_9ERIC|nr:hypothetical protein RHGRI_009164 [Rhododendron griersonianum]